MVECSSCPYPGQRSALKVRLRKLSRNIRQPYFLP